MSNSNGAADALSGVQKVMRVAHFLVALIILGIVLWGMSVGEGTIHIPMPLVWLFIALLGLDFGLRLAVWNSRRSSE